MRLLYIKKTGYYYFTTGNKRFKLYLTDCNKDIFCYDRKLNQEERDYTIRFQAHSKEEYKEIVKVFRENKFIVIEEQDINNFLAEETKWLDPNKMWLLTNYSWSGPFYVRILKGELDKFLEVIEQLRKLKYKTCWVSDNYEKRKNVIVK